MLSFLTLRDDTQDRHTAKNIIIFTVENEQRKLMLKDSQSFGAK